MKKETTPYQKKLLDPRWQKRRLEILNRDDFTCQSCIDNTKTLHVHHKRYLPNREPWEYEDKYLVTLCIDCHAAEGEMSNGVKDDLFNILLDAGFLVKDIREITSGIVNMNLLHCPDVVAEAYRIAFESPLIQRMLLNNILKPKRKRKIKEAALNE